MTADARPPYRSAMLVGGAVLFGYLLTLAPTVTFWDAGEFIAAARSLGIPHPPGTPLFVMIAHVWALAFPLGEYAFRTNLLSALLSAAGAGFLFLVAHESLRACEGSFRVAGAATGAILGAFTFTAWQNSNETEVYAVATFTIAAMAWLALLWRRERGTPRAGRRLLLLVYLAGISIGNHLLALLAGPAVIVFLVATVLDAPARERTDRRREWGEIAVVAGIWALLVATGLGSTVLMVAGAGIFLGCAAFAASVGAGGFAVAALGLAAIGVTPYLFLYLRAGQHPAIDEASPGTFDALLAVIRRAQYPPRTPLDDPTVMSGARNPGRPLRLLGLQMLDYLTYFDWQWARSIDRVVGPFPLRTLATLLFAALGLRGGARQRRIDQAGWWLLLTLFLVTGLGLVLYMNFKPGYGRWYDVYPGSGDHEVRERDYFFVVSFIVWGLWAGMGLADLAERLRASSTVWVGRVAPAVLVLAALPVALNWRAATRRGTPDARLAADFAYDLLNSAPRHAILFTYGDNDTFPLWWAQEVAGIRRDVTVVCVALANTDWYMRQLRDTPARPVDEMALPAVWRAGSSPTPDWPLHSLTDAMIASAARGYRVRGDQRVTLGPVSRTLADGTFLFPSDILLMSIIQQNLGRRPVVWAATAGRSFAGLPDHVVQRGMGFELLAAPPDTASPGLDLHRLGGVPLDVATTERLVWDTYRYAGLRQRPPGPLESTSALAASSLATPIIQLAYVYADQGDSLSLERALDAASRLSPNPEVRAALRSIVIPPDSAIP